MVQYRAQFLIHFPLSVLNLSRIDVGKCTGNSALYGYINFVPVWGTSIIVTLLGRHVTFRTIENNDV